MARLTGLGLADLPGGLAISGQQAMFERALARGVVTPSSEFRISDEFLSGRAFTPERMAEVYEHDRLWAGAATLIDGRRPGRCGGGGCNAPSCAHQYWNIGLPCNEQNLQAFMFQLPRFVWAQQRLNQLLLTPPTPFHLLTNQTIADGALGWSVWLSEVYRAMALLRWASNVRWELVNSKITLPFEPSYTGNPWGGAGSTTPLAQQFLDAVRAKGELGASSLLMETPSVWAYSQAGEGYDPDCRPWKVNQGDGGDVNALAWQLRVPTNAQAFSPRFAAWNAMAPTQPAEQSPEGRYYGFEYQCQRNPDSMNVRPGRAPFTSLPQFLAAGGDMDPGALTMRYTMRDNGGAGQYTRVKATRFGASYPFDVNGVSPLMQVMIARERANAYRGLEFGTVVSAGLAAWADMIAAAPEELRGQDAQVIEALQAGMMQAQLNESAGYVSAAFGTAAGVAMLIPQPYGAIVAAVIAVIGAIVVGLMSSAYELGLARPDRPPCPAPPLLRMIGSDGSGAEAACDFDQTRRGIEEVTGKALVISFLAGQGVTPDAWFPALVALAERPMDATPPVLPPPDTRLETPAWQYLVGGLAIGGGVLGILSLLGRK